MTEQTQFTNNFLGEDNTLLNIYKSGQQPTINPRKELTERLYTTSIKYKDIGQSPIGKKQIEQLPGIGSMTAKKMNEKGIFFIYQLLGIYLTFENSLDFKNYLKEEFEINKYYQICIANVISEYLSTFYNNKDKRLDQVTSFFLTHDLNLDLVRENFPTLDITQFEFLMHNFLG